jgi:hypothetical protein
MGITLRDQIAIMRQLPRPGRAGARAQSAVQMTPRGKRGKLKTRVSHSFHRAWKSGKLRRIPTFPPRRRRVLFSMKRRRKHEAKTAFRLTDAGHFDHYGLASGALLRSRPASRRNH